MKSTPDSTHSFNILEEYDNNIEEELYYDALTNCHPTVKINIHPNEDVTFNNDMDIENGFEKKRNTKTTKKQHLHLFTFKPPASREVMNEEGDADCAFSMQTCVNDIDTFTNELRRKLNNINNDTDIDGSIDDNEYVNHITKSGMYQGNSPLTMSSNGSINNSDVEIIPRKKNKYKKLTFEEVEKSLQKHYNKHSSFSSEFDILITFLKGQTHIYSQANKITLRKYYFFTIPAILITSSVAIIAPFLSGTYWSGWFISGLNAIVTLLISLSDRFKLQSSSEMFLNMSTQYNKFGISLEITRNQIFFTEDITDKKKMILEKLDTIEEKWLEFRESNPILVPIEIQMQNPIISHINIFSFIKKIEFYKKDLILKYKDIKNEIQYILHKWNEEEIENHLDDVMFDVRTIDSNGSENNRITGLLKKNREKQRLSHLLNAKQLVKTELIHYENAYVYIDDLFSREIQKSEYYETFFGGFLFWIGCISKSKNKYIYANGNPVVDNYLNFIFT
jgi:hypothetical protein